MKWSADTEALLRSLHSTHSANEIAQQLGCSRSAVKNRITKLGLKKSSNSGRFEKGAAPWNKGTKFDSGGRSHETRFKAGQMPHTWRPIGTERISKEGYLQRKLTDTGCTRRDYVTVHHIIWRDAGNTIQPGHALIFKDGNRRNFALDNLELITRADLMRRNSVHNHGPEIAELIRLRAQITRQINKQERTAP